MYCVPVLCSSFGTFTSTSQCNVRQFKQSMIGLQVSLRVSHPPPPEVTPNGFDKKGHQAVNFHYILDFGSTGYFISV